MVLKKLILKGIVSFFFFILLISIKKLSNVNGDFETEEIQGSEGKILLTVFAVDKYGRESSSELDFEIDTTLPVINTENICLEGNVSGNTREIKLSEYNSLNT